MVFGVRLPGGLGASMPSMRPRPVLKCIGPVIAPIAAREETIAVADFLPYEGEDVVAA